MKKLYRKTTVHPTPSDVSEHLLSFLPAAIMTLTAGLSPADKEVLAYLISCSSASISNIHRKPAPKTATASASKGGDDHPPCFNCSCFRCYMNYWVKWDSSPNRQLIHEVIDAFEDGLLKESKKEKNKKERRKGKTEGGKISLGLNEPKSSEASLSLTEDFCFVKSNTAEEIAGETGRGGDENIPEEEMEKGSVRKFVSFLGERIWGVWG